MTDLELVELALRRTVAAMGGVSMGYWFHRFAEELTNIGKEEREQKANGPPAHR